MAMSSFAIEVWAKYAVAVTVMTIRFITRWKMIGWRNFDGTDFWCVVAAVGSLAGFAGRVRMLTCLVVSLYNCVDMRLSSQYTCVYTSSSQAIETSLGANSLSAKYPTNIGLDKETAMQVPDDMVPLLVRGSKIAHFSWTMYICMIFSFKGVMLCLFRKVG